MTALLSHLCLLIPPLLYLLTLIFLHLLLFLLPPSAAEAVEATEAGTGEGHVLSDAPRPHESAEGDGVGRGEKRVDIKTLIRHQAICQDITLLHEEFSSREPFKHTWVSGIKEEQSFFFFPASLGKVFQLELLMDDDEEIICFK